MSNGEVEGRIVYTPSRQGNAPARGAAGRRGYYTYNTRTVGGQGSSPPPPPSGSGGGGGGISMTRDFTSSWASTLSGMREPQRVGTPSGVPSFLGSRRIIAGGWIITMIVIGFDDWHNHGILPRPARLWSASLFFGLLALASIIEAALPIINLIAIGYTITLLWQYFQGGGQFTGSAVLPG